MRIATSTPSSFGSGLEAMQSAQAGLAADAGTLAAGGPSVEAIVDLGLQTRALALGAALVRSAEQTSGSLLDVLV